MKILSILFIISLIGCDVMPFDCGNGEQLIKTVRSRNETSSYFQDGKKFDSDFFEVTSLGSYELWSNYPHCPGARKILALRDLEECPKDCKCENLTFGRIIDCQQYILEQNIHDGIGTKFYLKGAELYNFNAENDIH